MERSVGEARTSEDAGRARSLPEAGPEEDRLVEAARRDRAAFVPLYRAYAEPVYRYLAHHAANRQDAEDLTAATFAKALASLDRYRAQGTFAAWLFSIARHTLGDAQRRSRPQVDVEDVSQILVAASGQPEREAEQDEERRHLDRLVRQLPADQREALALRFFGGLRSAEVGAVMGRGDGAVRMLVHRAIAALREQLEQEEGS